ncbi:ATP-binding cassette domain-containing protein [Streptomyces indonesiensis]|uniref:ABC transporter ATP-binding protein n=1 Tax=Streptomyces violaceusniger group TaxID=2839105 RepID=UPI001FEC448B|nr:ATP-binding cassette domain-containing protein [Streptomyces indonesiensis]
MRLRGVGRRYGLGGPWVLRGVDLEVSPGSLTRVQGRNGSGKSTLLRLLAGIDAPSAGRITGRPPTAYVPERFPAELPFSALGYLTHLGRIHGLSRAAAARGAGEWLERFGADGYAGTPLAELSKGTSQKIAVAQALLAAPGLLVLDEAWTGLDQAARGVLDTAVAERVADGGAVVFVDHDPRRLAGAPDRVLRVTEARLEPVAADAHGEPGEAGHPRPSGGAPDPAAARSSAAEADSPAAAVRPRSSDPAAAARAARETAAGAPGREAVVPGAAGPSAAQGGPGAGPRVRVEAEGRPGVGPPGELSGAVVREYGPAPALAPAHGGGGDGPAGRGRGRGVRLTVEVGVADSDGLLRTLLTADPPWHIRAVTAIDDNDPQEPAQGAKEKA